VISPKATSNGKIGARHKFEVQGPTIYAYSVSYGATLCWNLT